MQSVTLNENRDFRRAYAKGKSRVHRLLVTYVLRNRLGVNRVGFTATKKIGKACRRNRARRVIREAYRILEPQLRQGYDIVFVARGRHRRGKNAGSPGCDEKPAGFHYAAAAGRCCPD